MYCNLVVNEVGRRGREGWWAQGSFDSIVGRLEGGTGVRVDGVETL